MKHICRSSSQVKCHTSVFHLHWRKFLFWQSGATIQGWSDVLLRTVFILSLQGAKVVASCGEFAISSVLSRNFLQNINKYFFLREIEICCGNWQCFFSFIIFPQSSCLILIVPQEHMRDNSFDGIYVMKPLMWCFFALIDR